MPPVGSRGGMGSRGGTGNSNNRPDSRDSFGALELDEYDYAITRSPNSRQRRRRGGFDELDGVDEEGGEYGRGDGEGRMRDAETGEWLEMENRMWMDKVAVLPPQAPSELRQAAAEALAAEAEAEALLQKEKDRRSRKARAKKLRALNRSRGGSPGGGKRKPRSRAEMKLQAQVDRMAFIKRATGRDGRPLLEDDRLTKQVVELVEMRDKHQAHLLTLLENEEAEEARRKRELKRSATNDEARAWVATRHARERRDSKLRIERIKQDNEMALVSKMADAGFVR